MVAADGGDGIDCDWADWIDPRLEIDPEAPHEFVSFSAKADKGTLHKGETAAITASGIRLDGTPVDGITGYCTYASSDEAVVTKAPWVSPWRTAIIGGPKEIVENTMPENLSPSCAIEDTSWIKPAITAWTWYVSPGYGPQSDPELIKQYIDVAAELGWKYFLMDEGWQGKYGTVDDSWHKWVGIPDWLDEVVAYGREKGVGIMAWVHSGDIDTPKEQEFIKELHDHGIGHEDRFF